MRVIRYYLIHSKITTTSISPYLSHLNGTFFPPLQFFTKCWQNTTMYKKLFMFLNEMIFDLSTREFFPIFNMWKNERTLPMAPTRANSTKAASEASLQFWSVRIARGVQFCFGHKSLWYPEWPSNDVAAKLQLTSFRLTLRLGAFLGFQANLSGG